MFFLIIIVVNKRILFKESDITLWSKPLTGGLALGVVSYRVDGYLYPYEIQLTDFFNDVQTEYIIITVQYYIFRFLFIIIITIIFRMFLTKVVC